MAIASLVLLIVTIVSSTATAWPGDHQGRGGHGGGIISRLDPNFWQERGDFGYGVLGTVRPGFGYGPTGAYCPRWFGSGIYGNVNGVIYQGAPFDGPGRYTYGRGGFMTCPY